MSRVLRPEDLRCPVTRKLAYPTRERATDELERAWQRPQTGGPCTAFPRRVYECPECGWWHLSSHQSRDDVDGAAA